VIWELLAILVAHASLACTNRGAFTYNEKLEKALPGNQNPQLLYILQIFRTNWVWEPLTIYNHSRMHCLASDAVCCLIRLDPRPTFDIREGADTL
jgi:hypothetical protein